MRVKRSRKTVRVKPPYKTPNNTITWNGHSKTATMKLPSERVMANGRAIQKPSWQDDNSETVTVQ